MKVFAGVVYLRFRTDTVVFVQHVVLKEKEEFTHLLIHREKQYQVEVVEQCVRERSDGRSQ